MRPWLWVVLLAVALPTVSLPAVAQGVPENGLYLFHTPPNAATNAPVLVLFDPGGDAEGAIHRAASAADANGVILVASRAFRDYLDDATYTKILAGLKGMLTRRFPESPIWAGGFSGGARIAVGWAQQEPGFLRGLICFGGFYDRGGLPPKGTRVFLACGNDDPGWNEMEQARAALQAAGDEVAWKPFLGSHQWPPEGVLRQALAFIAKLPREPAPAR